MEKPGVGGLSAIPTIIPKDPPLTFRATQRILKVTLEAARLCEV